MAGSEKRERLKEFYLEIRNCTKCELSKTRTNFVFGSGSADATIMFVGEAPGRNEDLQGKPFVGQAGRLLDELLLYIGLTRDKVFIANVLKCRPPGNRDPRLEEINSCKCYLFKQIEIIDPKIICTLGKHSTQLILNTQAGITSLRGRVFKIGKRLILPINHPAAALYTPSKMSVLREDFLRIERFIRHEEEYRGYMEEIEELHEQKPPGPGGMSMKDYEGVVLELGFESGFGSDTDAGEYEPGEAPGIADSGKDKGEQLELF
ncbi:MAG: uracil-DNA glycosylase [Actinobacteria bacterium]|nr:uracil-DNA glycosylase [Actinomycetota bacterium]